MVKRHLVTDGTVKKRKRRKPMTEEQRKAAAERLQKARERRAKTNPPEYKSIHPTVLEKGDDHYLSHKKVKQWIKTQKDLAAAERKNDRQGVKGALAKAMSHEGYVRNMERYLRDGDWCDLFYGEYQEHKIKTVCIQMAYDKDGNPKRSHGVFYPDLGYVWGEQPKVEENKE